MALARAGARGEVGALRGEFGVSLIAAAVPLALCKASPAGAGDGVQISPAQERPDSPGPAATFTGEVSVKPLFDANDVRTFGAAEVTFSPCARTAWHTHPGGQTLIVTAGTGWVQEWGGQKQQINPGDVVWTEPGVKHWHGAVDDAAMTHIPSRPPSMVAPSTGWNTSATSSTGPDLTGPSAKTKRERGVT